MSELIAFHPSDDDLKRAENILRFGGVAINKTARKALPRMAKAIALYRDIERANAKDATDE